MAGTALAEYPQSFTDADEMARAIYKHTDGEVRLALPLALVNPSRWSMH